MKKLTTTEMLKNLAMTTDNDLDYMWLSDKIDYYMTTPRYTAETKRKLIETAYESIMVRIALETMNDRTERYIFYIENGITVEVAEIIEEAFLPLLAKYEREGK
jgi:hypothetical protein